MLDKKKSYGEEADLNLIEISLVKLFQDKQRNELLQSLNECNKTAAFLTKDMAVTFARKVGKNNSHTFLGQETYLEENFVFSMKGFVPPYIIRRAKSVFTAGLAKVWAKLLSRKDYLSSTHPVAVVKPTMKGNILIIFILLFSGYLIGLSVITVEFLCHFCNIGYVQFKRLLKTASFKE